MKINVYTYQDDTNPTDPITIIYGYRASLVPVKLDPLWETIYVVHVNNPDDIQAIYSEVSALVDKGTKVALSNDLANKSCEAVSTCNWVRDESGTYETSCGKEWYFHYGNAMHNDCNFCPFCGNKLIDKDAH